jgi:hypothetical protein
MKQMVDGWKWISHWLGIIFAAILLVIAPISAVIPAMPAASAVPEVSPTVELAASACTMTFINEIHYDNNGPDSGEFIEIAGPAGTDLSGWSLVLYNGSNGDVYNNVAISGIIPDESMNFGTIVVDFSSNGIQNGSPDGVALVKEDTVVQFLSYEGMFTAINGPANGMTSTDIGVSELGTELEGMSVQLNGTGSCYEDFTWTGPIGNTNDAINSGQSFIDLAPFIAYHTPEADATGVPTSSKIVLTFSENVNATADAVSIVCNSPIAFSGLPVNNVKQVVLTPNSVLGFEETCTVTVDANKITDADPYDLPNEMSLDYAFSFKVTRNICNDPADRIHDIQGSGENSPLDGQVVEIQGIVVGDFHLGSTYNMFAVQEEEDDIDSNPLTSEGIIVYDGFDAEVNVSPGDIVRVSGTVDEYNGLTELTDVTVTVCGSGSITATSLTLPVSNLNQFEAVEGMRVTFPMTLTVAEHYNLARYGEVLLSGEGRLFQFTHTNAPSIAGYTDFLEELPLKTILLDDRMTEQNPDPVIHPAPRLEYDNPLRLGDTVFGLSGVMSYDFGAYRILPDEGIYFSEDNTRPETSPPAEGGGLKIAGINVLNYFNTFYNCTYGIGGGITDCRGAENAEEFERQHAKIVDAILDMDASVVGLVEIENDGYGIDSALQVLVNGLNDVAGAGAYDFINVDASTGITNSVGTDAIKVAIIYQTELVEPIGEPAVLQDTNFERYPLAQAFKGKGTEGFITVVVNHFKSKSCTNATSLDLDQGDGQGCYNARRTTQAQALVDWIATDPVGLGSSDYLVIGDLNAYALEDPIQVFTDAGFIDLVNRYEGDQAYSYVFDGQLGYLDHALASASAVSLIRGASHWHINADEQRALDYNLDYKTTSQQEYFYAPEAFRSSDHDPVLISVVLPYRGIVFAPVIVQNTTVP